jgi:hypothetical protein
MNSRAKDAPRASDVEPSAAARRDSNAAQSGPDKEENDG